jgi:hypothetical protein
VIRGRRLGVIGARRLGCNVRGRPTRSTSPTPRSSTAIADTVDADPAGGGLAGRLDVTHCISRQRGRLGALTSVDRGVFGHSTRKAQTAPAVDSRQIDGRIRLVSESRGAAEHHDEHQNDQP